MRLKTFISQLITQQRRSMFHKLAVQSERLGKYSEHHIINSHIMLSQKLCYDTERRMW